MAEPNFFLAGATKGGTSSLDLWLRSHPQVATPRRKEMHFFCRCPNPKLRVADNLEDYLAAFGDGEAVGESSPCYLYYPETATALNQFSGSRVIVSLRDPAERFWSHYLMNEIYRPTGLDAADVLDRNLETGRTNALDDLFGVGLYGAQLVTYLDVFGTERTHVMFLEETLQDPGRAVTSVLDFLGLDRVPLSTDEKDKQHVEPRGPLGRLFLRTAPMRRIGNAVLGDRTRRFLKTRVLGDPNRKPEMSANLRARLREEYADDSRQLEQLLGRPLPWDWHR